MRKTILRRLRIGFVAVLAPVCLPFPVSTQSVSVSGALTLGTEVENRDTETDYSNAVVWLTSTRASDLGVGPTPGHFEILQENKRFLPRILPMPVGSTVDFPNLDPFFHNVFSLFEGKRFDLGLYEAGTSRSTRFDRPGISYIFCNIHPDMVAVIIAVNTDLFGPTDAGGQFRIEAVPPGEYQLHVWHERMQPTDSTSDGQALSVGAADVEVASIPMEASGLALEDHTNKFGLEYESPATSGVPYLLPR